MNKVQCGKCSEILIPTDIHELRYCGCGETFIDVGDGFANCGFLSIPPNILISKNEKSKNEN
jgi:hypothetical protein